METGHSVESTTESGVKPGSEGWKGAKTAKKIVVKERAAKPKTATDHDRGIIRIVVVVIGIGRRINHLRRRDVDRLSDGCRIIGRRGSLLLGLSSRRLGYLHLWSALEHGGDDSGGNAMLMEVDDIVRFQNDGRRTGHVAKDCFLIHAGI